MRAKPQANVASDASTQNALTHPPQREFSYEANSTNLERGADTSEHKIYNAETVPTTPRHAQHDMKEHATVTNTEENNRTHQYTARPVNLACVHQLHQLDAKCLL